MHISHLYVINISAFLSILFINKDARKFMNIDKDVLMIMYSLFLIIYC